MTASLASQHGSLRDRVVDEVKERIISGDLPAGARLHERNLSQELGVSRVPLREAILTLAAQGLVEMRPRVGAFVRPMTKDYVEDLFAVRMALEPLAASLAARNRNAAHLAELARLVDAEREALVAGDDRRGSLVNAEFHLEILRASGNELLFSIMAPMQSQIQRLFRRTITSMSQQLSDDHGDMLEALQAQDADRATDAARRHVEETREISIALAD
ncbi:GntR family transcriptional regulator [soil metagenome]